jgi:hypothetical protein
MNKVDLETLGELNEKFIDAANKLALLMEKVNYLNGTIGFKIIKGLDTTEEKNKIAEIKTNSNIIMKALKDPVNGVEDIDISKYGLELAKAKHNIDVKEHDLAVLKEDLDRLREGVADGSIQSNTEEYKKYELLETGTPINDKQNEIQDAKTEYDEVKVKIENALQHIENGMKMLPPDFFLKLGITAPGSGSSSGSGSGSRSGSGSGSRSGSGSGSGSGSPPLLKTCKDKYGLYTAVFTPKNCANADMLKIITQTCRDARGHYFGVGGTTANDLAKMLMTGGNFVPLTQIPMESRNYTNTLIDTLNRLIKQVEAKGMVIDTNDHGILTKLMNDFSNNEKEAIKVIQTLYKLHENSKHLSNGVLDKDIDGKSVISTFNFDDPVNKLPLSAINDKQLKDLTDKLAEYKRTEGKLLLTCNKLMACINNGP